MMCTLVNNQETGLTFTAKKQLRCDATVKYCTITKNKEFGIVVTGMNNFSVIEKNLMITENSKAGIKLENDAHASII